MNEDQPKSARRDFEFLPHNGAPEKPKKSLWVKIAIAVCAALLLTLVAYVAVIASNVAKISTKPLDFSGLATDADGRTNILLLGVGDPGHAGEQLSDTMMIISIDTKQKRVAQISIPRDLRVDIPGYGSSKINSANVYGGVPLSERTVSESFGIPIHYYVKTNFSGLRQLVDAVGGVDVNVKERLVDTEYPCDDNQYKVCGLDIEPGTQHMDGARALQYARCRKGTCGNDFGRAMRQQEVINLVRTKATRWDTLLNPIKLTPVTAALHGALSTDMGAIQMAQFVLIWQQAEKNQPIRLVLHTGPGGYLKGAGGSSDLVPASGDFGELQSRIQNIFTVPSQPTDLPE